MQISEIAEGIVENIIYKNEGNGYCVFAMSVTDGDGDGDLTCVGYVPDLSIGESLKVVGYTVMHPTYGSQLQIQSFERAMPNTEQGIEKYLGSGVIKGIGPKLAKKIVQKFGNDTFTIIETTPEELAKIRGITLAKAYKIGAVFVEQAEQRQAIMYLQELGVSPVYAMKIFQKYKENTIQVVKTNPYRLADDIQGIGFKMSDKLAAVAGIAVDSPFRIKCGIKYVLADAVYEGHTFLPRDLLLIKTEELLNISSELIGNHLAELQIEKQIWIDKQSDVYAVYLSMYYHAEKYTAQKLMELSSSFEPSETKDYSKEIEKFEKDTQVYLHEHQKMAVLEALTNGVMVLTGGPGTGKTTTINTIISIFQHEGLTITLAAPTGRAAKRMTEATGMEAKTIHRLLEYSFSEDGLGRASANFAKDDSNPIETDVLIIDESSMVDILLMRGLLRAIPLTTRLILVGDVDQLPSVGAGNVLKDVIKSERLRVIRLTEVFRQARESAIIMNAHRINSGEYPEINDKDKDFFFVGRSNVNDVVQLIVELITERLPGFLKCDPKEDIQVLTPMKKSPVGVQNLNAVLQQALNPPSVTKPEHEFRNIVFRVGDKVMQIKNNYNLPWKIVDSSNNRVVDEGLGVFNGDGGIIAEIDELDESMTVKFEDDKIVTYDFSNLEELEPAYAITIHKSQGSEYPVVVIPIHSGPSMLMSRNLLYTAVTRAKKFVVIVGVKETLYRMVDNNREINRYSSLALRLAQEDWRNEL